MSLTIQDPLEKFKYVPALKLEFQFDRSALGSWVGLCSDITFLDASRSCREHRPSLKVFEATFEDNLELGHDGRSSHHMPSESLCEIIGR
jgi:hypothetical protein